MVVGKLDINMPKDKIEHFFFTSYAKINSRYIKNVNLICDTIKHQEIIGENSSLSSLSSDFLDMTPKSQATKAPKQK